STRPTPGSPPMGSPGAPSTESRPWPRGCVDVGVLALPPGGEQLTLAGIDMFTAAWCVLNSYVLEQPAAIEVANTDIAGYGGSRAEQPWQVETVHTLSLHIIGDVDHTTTP